MYFKASKKQVSTPETRTPAKLTLENNGEVHVVFFDSLEIDVVGGDGGKQILSLAGRILDYQKGGEAKGHTKPAERVKRALGIDRRIVLED